MCDMCGKNTKCTCNSNFDGHSDLEEIEETKYLDFDGEESIDEDFDDFFGAKAKARRQARKTKRLGKRGDNVASSSDAPTDKKNCAKFYQDKGMSKRSAILKCKLTNKFGTDTNTIAGVDNVSDDNVSDDEISDDEITTTADGMPKQAGLLGGKKGLIIIGAVGLIGLVGFLALRPRK